MPSPLPTLIDCFLNWGSKALTLTYSSVLKLYVVIHHYQFYSSTSPSWPVIIDLWMNYRARSSLQLSYDFGSDSKRTTISFQLQLAEIEVNVVLPQNRPLWTCCSDQLVAFCFHKNYRWCMLGIHRQHTRKNSQNIRCQWIYSRPKVASSDTVQGLLYRRSIAPLAWSLRPHLCLIQLKIHSHLPIRTLFIVAIESR